MDTQNLFFSKLFTEGKVEDLLDASIQRQIFDAEYQAIYDFALEYFRKHGATPRADSVAVAFPTFNFTPAPDALTFYAELAHKRFLHACVSDALVLAANALRSNNPVDAVAALRASLLLADDSQAEQFTTDWLHNEDIDARISAYEERKRQGGVDGISTPFPTLDAETQGWHPGELIYFTARTKTGKSWMLAKLAHWAWLQGARPLIISKEMPERDLARRIDAIHCEIPYSKLRGGCLDSADELKWKTELDGIRSAGAFPIVYLPRGGVAQVRAKLRRYRATNILFIDGAYLLEDDRGEKQDWLRLSNITKDLADLAKQEKIPVVVTLQLTDEDTVARSKAMLQDASVVLKMSRGQDAIMSNTLNLAITHHREGNNCEIVLDWDLDNTIIKEQEKGMSAAQPKAPEHKTLLADLDF